MRYTSHSGLPQWARVPALAWKTLAGYALRHTLNNKERTTTLSLRDSNVRSPLQAGLAGSACC
jgi:hypothetical protein